MGARRQVYEFKGMSGVRASSLEGVIARSANAFDQCLREFRIVSASGDHGAINVWRDDDGHFRCERQVYMSTKDSQKFVMKKDALQWVKDNLPKIRGES